MEICLNEIDSSVLGRPVLELLNPKVEDDLASEESAYVARYHPAYALCKVEVEDLAMIHQLENAGFRFIETQLCLTFNRTKPFDIPDGPYQFEKVESDTALEAVLAIVRETFEDDRWLVDPGFAEGRALSGKRYEAYVRRSFERLDENIYRLLDQKTGKTLAMITHRDLGNGQAMTLLACVHPDYKGGGPGLALLMFRHYNELLRHGTRRLITHVSARNYAVLNPAMQVKHRLVKTFIVLRKLYPSST